jgi:hypothetical protein
MDSWDNVNAWSYSTACRADFAASMPNSAKSAQINSGQKGSAVTESNRHSNHLKSRPQTVRFLIQLEESGL